MDQVGTIHMSSAVDENLLIRMFFLTIPELGLLLVLLSVSLARGIALNDALGVNLVAVLFQKHDCDVTDV